jgi:hypothetical protein
MQQTATDQILWMPESAATSRIAAARLGIGLVQGVVLYLLYHAATASAWPATEPLLFAPLLMVCALAPVILISSLGHLPAKLAAAWLPAAALVLGLLAFHDIWRGVTGYNLAQAGAQVRYPSTLLWTVAAAGFYIAHSLALAGIQDRRIIARYTSLFDISWKLAIQLMFSAMFVGALWLVLWLGASLFMLVQLAFLQELLRQPWFVLPVSAFAFACALHITDVRPAIVHGIRALLLVLLSWILPVTTLLVGGFLLSLPWTGLQPLWATRHATAVLLGAAAVLVLLINAAFQNGEISVARVVRLSAQAAALLLPPIVAIAVYSLGLRVAEYGWTTDRIIAACCLLVAACYALGYAWAACRRDDWLAPVAGVNVATAFVILAVLLALFSPVADPARLSVASQMARFDSGRTSADRFDFDYLRFEGARYGQAALERLKTHAAAPVREQAALALNRTSRWPTPLGISPTPADLAAGIRVWPRGAALPPSFLRDNWNERADKWELPACLSRHDQTCDAHLVDFNGDGKPEVLLAGLKTNGGAALLMEGSDGHWIAAGRLPPYFAGCEPLLQPLREGAYRLTASGIQDLEIGGRRIVIERRNKVQGQSCPPPVK